MKRRQFIRIVGGGVIGAAGVAGSGCSTGVPPEAIAPWQGPANDADDRIWVLSHAILAPHSHNLQSWLVDLSAPDEIVLYCDRERLLPQTDPFSRQIMMSHGTFLEILALAAGERGLRSQITLFPEGEFSPTSVDDRPVAHIKLVRDATVTADPLFAAILQRRTNRGAYRPQEVVPEAAWKAMAGAVAGLPVSFGFVSDAQPAVVAEHRAIAAEAWRIEMTTPRTILESLAVLRVGPAEIAMHRDGLTLTDPLAVWMTRLGLFDRSVAPGPDDYATRSQIADFNEKLATTPAFMWLISEGNERATQVAAGRAYARAQLAATASGLAMQPLSQALQEYAEQAHTYAAIHALLGAPTPGHTVQLWARVGYADSVPPSPRRAVDAIVLASS